MRRNGPKLIEEDKVDLIIAATLRKPSILSSAVAERCGVPCVAIEAPVDTLGLEPARTSGPIIRSGHWKLCMNCIPICGNKPVSVPEPK